MRTSELEKGKVHVASLEGKSHRQLSAKSAKENKKYKNKTKREDAYSERGIVR